MGWLQLNFQRSKRSLQQIEAYAKHTSDDSHQLHNYFKLSQMMSILHAKLACLWSFCACELEFITRGGSPKKEREKKTHTLVHKAQNCRVPKQVLQISYFYTCLFGRLHSSHHLRFWVAYMFLSHIITEGPWFSNMLTIMSTQCYTYRHQTKMLVTFEIQQQLDISFLLILGKKIFDNETVTHLILIILSKREVRPAHFIR